MDACGTAFTTEPSTWSCRVPQALAQQRSFQDSWVSRGAVSGIATALYEPGRSCESSPAPSGSSTANVVQRSGAMQTAASPPFAKEVGKPLAVTGERPQLPKGTKAGSGMVTRISFARWASSRRTEDGFQRNNWPLPTNGDRRLSGLRPVVPWLRATPSGARVLAVA